MGPFFNGNVFGGGFFGGGTPRRSIAEGLRRKQRIDIERQARNEQILTIVKSIAPYCFDEFDGLK